MAPRWGGLRPEPYDPDARDADGDGIVQEGTAWERPVGTRLLDDLGRDIVRGASSGTRPRGLRVVGRDGKDIDYTPTYGAAPTSTPSKPGQGTPLSDHGAGSLKERGVRDLSQHSTSLPKEERRSVRAITDPRPSAEPSPEPKRDVPEAPEAFTPKLRKGRAPITEPYSRYELSDEDGIVQRGTIWERPANTYFLDNAGKPISHGVSRRTRPLILIGDEGKPIEYVPTYERPDYIHPLEGAETHTIAGVKLPYLPGTDFNQQVVDSQFKAQRDWLRDEAAGFVDDLSPEQLQKALTKLDLEDKDALIEYMTDEMVGRVADYVDEVRQGPLYVAVTPAALQKILRDKRMKTQFETGTSGGAFQPKIRVSIEENQMGIPKDLPDELRPIYGFQLGREEGDSVTQAGAAQAYGSIVIKLNDRLRARTTMVAGDSLDHQLHAIPVDGDVPPERHLAAARRDYNEIWDTAIQGAMSSLTEDVLGEAYDWEDGYEDIVMAGAISHYNEIQVHGGVTIDDIDEVIYPSDWVQRTLANPRFADIDQELVEETRKKIIEMLDQAGIEHGEDW